MSPAKSAADEAARALEHRLRSAAGDGWDTDRCHLEARAFIAELRHRGWAVNPDADWRPRAERPRANPDHVAALLADVRQAIRENRPPATEGNPT